MENTKRLKRFLVDISDDLGMDAEFPSVSHSPDFRSVKWFGSQYSFTVNQAPVIRLLYENYQKGTPDVGDETLLLSVDSTSPPARLSTLFRDNPAWKKKMIVAGGSKGSHRLADQQRKKT